MRIINGPRVPLLFLVLASFLGSSSVQASTLTGPEDTVSSPPYPRRWAVMANVGTFSAIGLAGVTGVYRARPWLELEAGVGLGFSGLQIEVMPRLVFGKGVQHFVMGVGPSQGIGLEEVGFARRGYRTTWINAELGYELRSHSGLGLLIVSGLTAGVAGCTDTCDHNETSESHALSFSTYAQDYVVPQGRIAVGYWF